ncbi:MAG: type III pantothenate kinase, partial [Planctomycetes bacterium]|nr:type III pantothenate kinase [Planctomycetota bacterium]
PGLEIAIKGLGRRCAQLPEVQRAETGISLVGRDTETAIQSGIFHGFTGLVSSLVQRMARSLGSSCVTVATGGDAPYFVAATSLFDLHDSDLMLKGISLAYQSGKPA